MKIFLNPGHCVGSDSGACGFGYTEAEIVLDIANRVAEYLKVADCEVKVFQFDGLAEIVDVANYWNADLFVSIHCNAYDSLAHGTESFYFENSVEGKKLAQSIQNQIVSKTGTLDRGIKPAHFYVIRHTNCPAVLVETAFIDNYHDADLLKPIPDVIDKPVDKTN